MTARPVTPPVALAVSLAVAKENLRLDADDTSLDAIITAWIEGITDYAEHHTGRAIINQTWKVTLDAFPDAIKLPNAPLVSVASVIYIDENGDEQTLDPADYVVDSISEPGYVVPAADVTWPTTATDRINTVSVTYTCGYGADESFVPKGIKNFILARLVEVFDPATRPEKDTLQSNFTDRLLDKYRVYDL